jgi:menaquinone-specific isochorismate synthase
VSDPVLVARTRRLDSEVDLLAVAGGEGVLFSHPDRGLAGFGTAATISLDLASPATAAARVEVALGRIEVIDEVGQPGTGPVAMGALPFAPGTEGTLVIPSVVVGQTAAGTRWMTTIGPADEAAPDLPLHGDGSSGAAGDVAPTRYAVAPERSPDDWCRAVEKATVELGSGEHRKVVLTRAVRVEADAPFDREAVLGRLQRSYPSCHLFAHGGFVGASPELLVSRVDDIVRCQPMAGTAPRSADPSTDARLAASLLSSAKDREEHQITIDMVHDTLLPWCSYLDWEPEPHIAAMANVQHLATRMEGRLSDPPASVVELMAALHPTPAVGGSPRSAALEMIDRFEELDRGCFGGPVGWVDHRGNGEWAVAIRSAHLDGRVARCFAGVGVVADSDPAAELAETRAKLQAMLSALIQP